MTKNDSMAPHKSGLDEVAIIGAGFGGLGLAIRMQQQGLNDFVIYERAGDVGGVWRDNVYPGAACDVPSHLYSFSFEPKPDWGRTFGPQQEIFHYLRHCADKYKLRDKIKFNAALSDMVFCEASGVWTLTFADGSRRRARAVVMAIGALNIPQYPAITGVDNFTGKVMHTAEWDKTYSLVGKRVAVIGTGASAIQVIPSIQPKVQSLKVFQRTPPWVMPKFDKPLSLSRQRLYRRWPILQKTVRRLQYLLAESVVPAFMWDSFLTRFGEAMGRRYLRKVVANPVLREKLTPHYAMGCKRVLLSDEYYPALTQDNVSVCVDGIEKIDERAVYTLDGERHEVDAIIFATGFKVPVSGAPIPIRGAGGRLLDKDWAVGSEAYKGMAVSGYPNMLYVMGPNTGPGNTSVIFYIESQINYILKYLKTLRNNRNKYLDLKPMVQREFNADIQQRFIGTTWTSGCNSWYLTKDGKNTTLWPSFSWQYRLTTRHFSAVEYEFLATSNEAPTSESTIAATS
ncbi:flavin-containing monooxygenase [Zhongshania arctica]|uniref:Flavin-containing monooxygenase n=1 Tax=Zhongshania arctica TaxID=3238302 RepID=A0ABV3TX77_9GAMM